jgi:hypothetical protein
VRGTAAAQGLLISKYDRSDKGLTNLVYKPRDRHCCTVAIRAAPDIGTVGVGGHI